MDEGVIELRFDGKRFGHWQKCDVRESVEDLCTGVALELTLPGVDSNLGLTANTKVELFIDNELVATLRPDQLRRAVGAESHTITFEARSLGRELVDCQYSKTFKGLKLGEIVKRLGSTFQVPVKVEATTAVVPDFSMQCEQPANAMINAARSANVLIYPTPDGGVIMTEPSKAEPIATLEYGVHILEYEVVDEYKERFSDYTVKSFDHENDKAIKGAVQDDGIKYFRPMHVVADKSGHSIGSLQRRAQLERNRRLARSRRIVLKVQGWRYKEKDGALKVWPINKQVRVVIPGEEIDDVFLIGERSFRIDDEGGRVVSIDVMHRDAFQGKEPKDGKKKATGGKRRTTAKGKKPAGKPAATSPEVKR